MLKSLHTYKEIASNFILNCTQQSQVFHLNDYAPESAMFRWWWLKIVLAEVSYSWMDVVM